MEKKKLIKAVIITAIFELLILVTALWLTSPAMIESDFVTNITKPSNWLIVMFIIMIIEVSLFINVAAKLRKYVNKKRDDRTREIYTEESRNNKNKD